MTSNNSHQRKTLTTDEFINALFADDACGDKVLERSNDSEEEETSNDEETNTSVTTDTDATNGRGQHKRRGPRTRRRISRVQLKQQAKGKEQEAMEA